MKFDKSRLGRRWIPYTIATCSAVVLYLILAHLGGIWKGIQGLFSFITPVFWGAIIAYIIDALVVLYQRTIFRRAKRPQAARKAAILLAIVTILVLAALFAVALIPQLIQSVSALISNLGNYISSLRSLLSGLELEVAGYPIDLTGLTEYGETLVENLATTLQDNIGRILNTSYNIGKGFINVFISFILAIYFLLEKDVIKNTCKKLLRMRLSQDRYIAVVSFLRRCNHILIRFIACDLLDGLVVGLANFIFMKICGMPYAVLISVVVGVTNLIPTFGPVAGGAIGAFILLLVTPRYVLWFLVFTVILQTVDGYILKPKLYGDTLGISPLWVLVTIVVGGRMFGTAGVILAIPFAAISDFLFRDLVWKRAQKKKASGGPPAEG